MLSWIARLRRFNHGSTATVSLPSAGTDLHPAPALLLKLLKDDLGFNERTRIISHLKECTPCCVIVAKALKRVPRESRSTARRNSRSKLNAVILLIITLGLIFVVLQFTSPENSTYKLRAHTDAPAREVASYRHPFAPAEPAPPRGQPVLSNWWPKLVGRSSESAGAPLWFGGVADANKDWRWRIRAGELERAPSTGGIWEQIKVGHDLSLNTVAVAGRDVWVGGRAHSLYRSSNAGTDWQGVDLVEGSVVETDDISSIRFVDAQHGFVVTIGGGVWRTDDGGGNWHKQ